MNLYYAWWAWKISSFTDLSFYIEVCRNKMSFTKATCSTIPGCFTYFFSPSYKRKGSNDSGAFIILLEEGHNAVALNYVMYVFPFLPLRPRPLITHTFPEFIRKCTSRHFLKSALLSTQIFAWDHFFSIFSPFSLFFSSFFTFCLV